MQLTLSFETTSQDATFDTYHFQNNDVLQDLLKSALLLANGPKRFYLYGEEGLGKTHLLQAACHYCGEKALAGAYIPLKQVHSYGLDIFEGLDHLPLLCIDDLDVIAGDKAFEEAIFHLYNRARDNDVALLISGKTAPNKMGLVLPDLVSRLSWEYSFALSPLADAQKKEVLQLKAQQRGIELSDSVAQYILTHYGRDMGALVTLLEKLDTASLSQKRRITIPFIKSTLP